MKGYLIEVTATEWLDIEAETEEQAVEAVLEVARANIFSHGDLSTVVIGCHEVDKDEIEDIEE